MRKELHNDPIPEEEEDLQEVIIEKEPSSRDLELMDAEFVEPFEANPLKPGQLDLQHDREGLSQYIEDLKPYIPDKPPSKEKYEEMFQNGDNDGLFYAISMMVVSQAIKRSTQKIHVMDLVQAGNEAIIKSAISTFKPEKSKFSTWAMWWIRQSQGREIKKNFREYKISEKIAGEAWMVQKEYYEFMARHNGEKPSNADLAGLSGFPTDEIGLKKVTMLMDIAEKGPKRLSSTPNIYSDVELGDGIKDPEASYGETMEDGVDDKAIFEFYSQEINRRLQPVGDKFDQGRLALRLRLGIDENGIWTGKYLTLQAVGDRFNVTRERIRQLQNSGLAAFRDDRTLFTILSNHLFPKIARPISEQIAQDEMSRKRSKK